MHGHCRVNQTVRLISAIVTKPAHPSTRDRQKLTRYKQATDDGEEEKAMSMKEHRRLDLMLLVYWTCVQMES
jgi:hypothetical protein